MKAENLIIGDWLQDSFGNIGQVYRLDPGRVHLRLLQERPQDGEYIVHDIEPIPLTPEILEKNGFNEEQKRVRFVVSHKECQLTYYFNSNWFSIYKNANVIGSDYPIFICAFQERIKYVHELQHALKLCEINKEIVV